MPAILRFNGNTGGGLPPFPPPAPEVRVLLEDPATPGVAQWRCLRAADLCTNPPGFSNALAGVTPSPLEIGAQLVSPLFNATYFNGTPTTSDLSDSDAFPVQNVVGVPNPITRPHTYQKALTGQTTVFTLTSDIGGPSFVSNVTYTWLPRVYWGLGPDGLSTEADIEGLSNSALAASYLRQFVLNAGPAQFMYYAFPSAFGTPTFFVNNFEGGFILQAAAVPVTANTPGAPVNAYDLWKSVLPGLGNTTVDVT